MVFNSISFLLFFAFFFNFYWWVSGRKGTKHANLTILLGSYFFYGFWDWRFLSLIVASSICDFIIGIKIDQSNSFSSKKRFLYFSLAFNLSILGFFKYFNFFLDSLKSMLSIFSSTINFESLDIILPVGISFYTFQTMSYTIDVYRGKIKPTTDIVAFFTYVSFFPQLIAGPIERASKMLPQFQLQKEFTYKLGVTGLQLILWGLFKKIVIGDNLAIFVDQIFDPSFSYSGLTILFGTLCFSIQIYCDFSGYSDIAIGLAKLLGFNLSVNFRTPYFSASFKEFWGRWHITLSTWFRDYVYIPLGGNRVSENRTAINLLLTFLLSGLWHGAQITFLIWGAVHGVALILEKNIKISFPKVVAIPFTFILVTLFWLPFRAEGTQHLIQLCYGLVNIGNLDELSIIIAKNFNSIKIIILGIAFIVFLTLEVLQNKQNFSEYIHKKSKAVQLGVYYSLVLLILFLINFNVKPNFIYFQF